MQLFIAFLLHAYQPWWQFPSVLEKITNESYAPIFKSILTDERIKLSLNLNYSLLELFKNNGFDEQIRDIVSLLKSQRIEFTGTAAYHPFMPLISEWMRIFQISLQEKGMKTIFHDYNPKGFFLPEMGFSKELTDLLINRGYIWTITDDPPFIAHNNKKPPYNYIISPNINKNTNQPFGVFLRSKYWSFDRIANSDSNGKDIAISLAEGVKIWSNGSDAYIVIAMDFETFNHHKKDYWNKFMLNFLDAIQQQVNGISINLVKLSELYSLFEKKEETIPNGSWSTSEDQYRQGNFYPLWQDKGCGAHKLIWQIYNLSEPYAIDNNEAAIALAKGMNSCTFWQIPMGNPHLSKYGVDEIVKAAEISNNPNLKKIYKLREKLREKGI